MSVVVDFSVVPVGKGESLSAYVARCVKVVAASGLPFHLHAMGTELEAESFALAAEVIDRCIAALSADCDRVSATIKVDLRKGRSNQLAEKVASVQRKLS